MSRQPLPINTDLVASALTLSLPANANVDHASQDALVLRVSKLALLPKNFGTNETRETVFENVMTIMMAANDYAETFKMIPEAEIQRLITDERIQEVIDEACKIKQFRRIRELAVLRKTPPPSPLSKPHPVNDEGRKATLDSWQESYVGSAHKVLYKTITKLKESEAPYYAQYQAVVQSSGMGKSRMVDELSKEHLVIPVNLRAKEEQGFPPGDNEVSEFLIRTPFRKDDACHLSHAFLISLLMNTLNWLKNNMNKDSFKLAPQKRRENCAREFRNYMSAGQTFEAHGAGRIQFYKDVISDATSLMGRGVRIGVKQSNADTSQSSETQQPISPTEITFGTDGPTLCHAVHQLLRFLDPNLPVVDGLSKTPPLVFFAFDEAHTLSHPKAEKGMPPSPTVFSEMRRAIRQMNEYPVFALFLSTTGKIHDFTPPSKDDPSLRVTREEYKLVHPFIELGFDQMVDGTMRIEKLTIEKISQLGSMTRFGRPLFGSRYKHGLLQDQQDILKFAQSKLTGGMASSSNKFLGSKAAKLACMSVRLALEFNATSTEIRTRELEQVEKYMRVCVLVHDDFETAITISPSEPILAEASRYLLHNFRAFNLPRSLLEELEQPGLDKGDRGVLIAEVLLILAVDAAYWWKIANQMEQPRTRSQVVEQDSSPARAVTLESFICHLLAVECHNRVFNSKPAMSRTKTEGASTFRTTFRDARVYFNHFIKIDDPRVISRDFLWRLLARGAAVLCANGQAGVDIVIPFMKGPGSLGRENISAIFIQVKNDRRFSTKPNLFLFDMMNPYFLRFFDMDERQPFPVIRMVFALSSQKSVVRPIQMGAERPLRDAKNAAQEKSKILAAEQAEKSTKKSPRYTAYDIWCAGAFDTTFRVIEAEDNGIYADLLKVCKVFPHAYSAGTAKDVPEAQTLRRMMNPGTAVHADHWAQFCGANVVEQTDDALDEIDFNYEESEDDMEESVEEAGGDRVGD